MGRPRLADPSPEPVGNRQWVGLDLSPIDGPWHCCELRLIATTWINTKNTTTTYGKYRAPGWILLVAIAASSIAFLLERFGLPFEIPWNFRWKNALAILPTRQAHRRYCGGSGGGAAAHSRRARNPATVALGNGGVRKRADKMNAKESTALVKKRPRLGRVQINRACSNRTSGERQR